MSLSNFFRINLPYGMKKIGENKWFLFNREYIPIGWNDTTRKSEYTTLKPFEEIPVHTSYKKLTDNVIFEIIKDKEHYQLDKDGSILSVWFYLDKNQPQLNDENWKSYCQILKKLSKYEV